MAMADIIITKDFSKVQYYFIVSYHLEGILVSSHTHSAIVLNIEHKTLS